MLKMKKNKVDFDFEVLLQYYFTKYLKYKN